MTKEQEINNQAAFIKRASLCDYNHLWTCTHKESKGEKCTALCKNFIIKGIKQDGVPSNT